MPLTSLQLQSNQFTSLPDTLPPIVTLSSLDLSENLLTSIDVLGQMSNLTALAVNDNNLGQRGASPHHERILRPVREFAGLRQFRNLRHDCRISAFRREPATCDNELAKIATSVRASLANSVICAPFAANLPTLPCACSDLHLPFLVASNCVASRLLLTGQRRLPADI